MTVLGDYFAGAEEVRRLKQRIVELEEEIEDLKEKHAEKLAELKRKVELAKLYGSNAGKVRYWKQLYHELKEAVKQLGIGEMFNGESNVTVTLTHGEIIAGLRKRGEKSGIWRKY